jgi:site-specific recombinase XerD
VPEDNIRKRAGLTGISPHVCRHTFASRLAMAGVDLRTIQELGRWASLSMVQRYANLSKIHKAEAIEKLAETSPAIFTTPAGEKQCGVQMKIAINS